MLKKLISKKNDMNTEKRKALSIVGLFALLVIIIPFSAVVIFKPSGESMITFSHLIQGLVLLFIGIIGIYAGWKIKKLLPVFD
jgi:hypothetical protein